MQRGSVAVVALILTLFLSLTVFGLLLFHPWQKNDVVGLDQTTIAGQGKVIKNVKAADPVVEKYNDTDLNFQFEYRSDMFSVVQDSEVQFDKRENGNYRKNFSGY